MKHDPSIEWKLSESLTILLAIFMAFASVYGRSPVEFSQVRSEHC